MRTTLFAAFYFVGSCAWAADTVTPTKQGEITWVAAVVLAVIGACALLRCFMEAGAVADEQSDADLRALHHGDEAVPREGMEQ